MTLFVDSYNLHSVPKNERQLLRPFKITRYGTVRYGTVRYGTVRYGTVYVISGLRREIAENCAFLGYYSASSGNS